MHVDPIEPANLEMHGLVPQKWHEVFGRVLAKQPDDRYQTATAFVQDLEYCLGAWFGGLGTEETIATGIEPSPRRFRCAPTRGDDPATVAMKAPPPGADDSPATVAMKAAPPGTGGRSRNGGDEGAAPPPPSRRPSSRRP